MRFVCPHVVFVVAMIFTTSSNNVLPHNSRPNSTSATQR